VCTFCVLKVEDTELEGVVVFHVQPRSSHHRSMLSRLLAISDVLRAKSERRVLSGGQFGQMDLFSGEFVQGRVLSNVTLLHRTFDIERKFPLFFQIYGN
jgi:hypothetical protein